MNAQEILSLVQAGYTKTEINAMLGPVAPAAVPDAGSVPTPAPAAAAGSEPTQPAAQNAEPVPAPAPAAVPTPAPTPAPTAAPEPAPAAEPTMKDLMLQMAKLTSAIQANAIASSIIPGGAQDGPKAEDALAQIIRPTFTERK